MMLAQELSERDHANRRAISVEILEQVPAAAVLLSSDDAHFHCRKQAAFSLLG